MSPSVAFAYKVPAKVTILESFRSPSRVFQLVLHIKLAKVTIGRRNVASVSGRIQDRWKNDGRLTDG